MVWPVNGDVSRFHLASGAGYAFHYDFMNAWDETTLAAMVSGRLNAARQGRDDQQPSAYVLNSDYLLP
jgi:hypothetical protein